jgi:tetratricopeptide (TPR) repeat protein
MACPDDNVLGAYVARGLAAKDSERIAAHFDDCASCREAVVALVKSATPPTVVAHGTPSLSPPAADEPLALGTRVGRYELRSLIGAGGMGHVYEAYDADLDRAIALKVLRPELAGSPAVLAERLLRESRLMAKVVDPAVITVYDVGRHGDRVFIAMELIRGETLGAYIARVRPPWRELVRLFECAAYGLAAAQARGIVHRDFKPDNVLVEVDGGRSRRVVVTDFGIARATALDGAADERPGEGTRGSIRLTATGVAVGTPAYMAPEQLTGGTVDARSDVFAFGVSLWEALFSKRPFPGNSVDAIQAAMSTRPQPPRRVAWVPRRLVRALHRALAIDPSARWPDLAALARELTAIRRRRRTLGFAAAAVALVGIGLASAPFLATPPADPCESGIASIRAAFDRGTTAAALEGDPRVRTHVLGALARVQTSWIATHLATCHADREPAQPPTVTACLEARRLELASFAADVVADGPAHALSLGAIVGDPARCATPSQSSLFSRVPDDPLLRRRVTLVRYAAFDAEAERDRGEFAAALAHATRLVADAATTWPPLRAETLYLLGTTQSQGGDVKTAIGTLREAAALAEKTHHDYIAANSWIQLVLSTTFDQGDPARGLEYVTYAEAALDRLGHPDDVTALLEYAKGTTLAAANRTQEAEVSLRHAVELAETAVPGYVPLATEGLGFVYEQEGRYEDAVAAFRRALASSPRRGAGTLSTGLTARERLAANLVQLGRVDEALPIAREAVALADRTLPADNQDRLTAHVQLAFALQNAGRFDEALVEARVGVTALAMVDGGRDERYGEALSLEATILASLGRPAEAEARFARACDVIAFTTGEGSSAQVDCWQSEIGVLFELGRKSEAVALGDKLVAALEKLYPAPHSAFAQGLITRGQVHAQLGQPEAAIADFERALGVLAKAPPGDPGIEASARWGLARQLWTRDHTRATIELARALKLYDRAPPAWQGEAAMAAEWLATNGHPRKL